MNNIRIETEVDNRGIRQGMVNMKTIIENAADTSTKSFQSFKDKIGPIFLQVKNIASKTMDHIEKATKAATETMKKNFKNMSDSVKKSIEDVKKVADGLKNAMTGPLGIATAILGAIGIGKFKETIDGLREVGAQLATTNNVTGITIKTLETLRISAMYAGSSMDEVADSMKDFSKNLGEARRGNEDLRLSFNKLGVDINDGADKVIKDLLVGFAKMYDQGKGAEALAQGMTLFGESFIKTFQSMVSDGVKPFEKAWSDMQNKAVFDSDKVAKVETFRKYMVGMAIDLQAKLSELLPTFAKIEGAMAGAFKFLTGGLKIDARGIETLFKKIITLIRDALLMINTFIGKMREGFAGLKSLLQNVGITKTINFIFDNMKLKALEAFRDIKTALGKMFSEASQDAKGAQKQLLEALGKAFNAGMPRTRMDIKNELNDVIAFNAKFEAAHSKIKSNTATIEESAFYANPANLAKTINNVLRKSKLELELKNFKDSQLDELSQKIENLKARISTVFIDADIGTAIAVVEKQTNAAAKQINDLAKATINGMNIVSTIKGFTENKDTGKQAEVNAKTIAGETLAIMMRNAELQAEINLINEKVTLLKGTATLPQLFNWKRKGIGGSEVLGVDGLNIATQVMSSVDGEALKATEDQKRNIILSSIQQTADAALSMWGNFNSLKSQNDQQALDAWKQGELDRINSTAMTTRMREREMKKIDKEEKKRQLESKEDMKAQQIAAISMSTATALGSMWASIFSVPKPMSAQLILGGITSAMITAGAGAQIAQIAKYADGGIVPGKSYTGDRVPANVNSGEMILNQNQQKQLFAIANGQATGSSGGINITIQGNVTDDKLRELEDMLTSLQSNGRLSGIVGA